MNLFKDAHPFADIAPHYPPSANRNKFPSLSLSSLFSGGRWFCWLKGLMSGAIQQTVFYSLIVGEWRKEGGKVKCFDKKKVGPRIVWHNQSLQKSELKPKKQYWLIKELEPKTDQHNRPLRKSEL
jgi:hypothetical protein